MSAEPLPQFRYFVDPVADGVIKTSDHECICCERSRGYIYVGHAYSEEDDYEESFCPWCIASGEAAREFDVEFIDDAGVGGYGAWEKIPEERKHELITRTPCFSGWQSEQWFTHCGDAATYLGRAGQAELTGAWSGAVDAIRAEANRVDDWDQYLAMLHRDGDCTAYVFRCLHCGQLGGYSDCN